MHYLDIHTFGLNSQIAINGVVIARDEDGGGLRMNWPLNEWLRPGANVVTTQFDWPSSPEPDGRDDAKIVVRLCKADPEAGPMGATVLEQSAWTPPDAQEQAEESLPQTMTLRFDVPNAPSLRLWSDTDPLAELTPQDEIEIVQLIESFRLAVLEGRHEEAYELSEIKYLDDACANGSDVAELRETVIEQFGWLSEGATTAGEPVQVATSEFALCGEGRLVHVTKPNNDFSFEVVGEEMKASVQIYVASIAGEWAIVR